MTVVIGTQPVALDSLAPFPGNARRGNVGLILDSLRANGQYKPLVVRRHGGGLTILAGNHTHAAMLSHEESGRQACEDWEGVNSRPCQLCASTGRGPTASAHIIECDDATATRINLADNKTTDVGGYDGEALAALLASLDDDLVGTGYDTHDLDSVVTAVAGPAWEAEQTKEMALPTAEMADPNRWTVRHLPIDAIISHRIGPTAWAAYQMGFQLGMLSSDIKSARQFYAFHKGFRLGFMDNEWHGYDHAEHAAAVAEIQPKYATVRDVMTKAQCEESGVEFYPLSQILEWAEEISEHADNVIMIPKYDCLDKIPEKYVIGYSVPTSYGGTPMPAAALKSRRVHLLGGSWANQLRMLNVLGDDVVSFDNNHLSRISGYGRFYTSGGGTGRLQETFGIRGCWQAAAILSLSAIRNDLQELFGAQLQEPTHPDINNEADDGSYRTEPTADGGAA